VKVYTVEHCWHWEKYILGVYSTKEKAQEAIKASMSVNCNDPFDNYEIEEWVLDV